MRNHLSGHVADMVTVYVDVDRHQTGFCCQDLF